MYSYFWDFIFPFDRILSAKSLFVYYKRSVRTKNRISCPKDFIDKHDAIVLESRIIYRTEHICYVFFRWSAGQQLVQPFMQYTAVCNLFRKKFRGVYLYNVHA